MHSPILTEVSHDHDDTTTSLVVLDTFDIFDPIRILLVFVLTTLSVERCKVKEILFGSMLPNLIGSLKRLE